MWFDGWRLTRSWMPRRRALSEFAVLRDVINATVGFEQSAADLQKPSKSLHRMLSPGGNPSTANFFAILQVLRKTVGTRLTVKAA